MTRMPDSASTPPPSPADPFGALAEELGTRPPPVVIFNKSHSGSRLLAQLLQEAGVFMGTHLNESRDSLDVLRLVEHLVGRHYPDYGALWHGMSAPVADAARVARDAFSSHLEALPVEPAASWGWKLCETTYILPIVDRLFPKARYIHLIRDGRDVAWCNHRGPDSPFWRKIYFNTDRIRVWAGLPCTTTEYRRRPHIYNALHWLNSVTVGRAFGAMLRDRYIEVRYEDLCRDFETTATAVLRFVGVSDPGPAIRRLAPSVGTKSIGKFRNAPVPDMDEVLAITKPTLLSLGYLSEDPESPDRAQGYRWLKALFGSRR